MSVSELRRRIAFLLHRSKRIEEVDEEMRLHAELRARSLREAGLAPQFAANAAERQLGNRTHLKEAAWDVWSFATVESVWLDVKFSARVLRSSPGFTALAVLTLALGIGATTAMFSIIDNVLLEPFPYAHQKRLVSLVIHDASSSEAGGRSMFPPAEFLDIREQNHVFEDGMGVGISRALWETGGALESVNAPLVTANAFQFLGVPPLLGRFATPADVKAGAAAVCVMSYSFWQNRFAGDPRVVGKILTLDGTPRIVIGVMPRRFVFWSGDVWIPTQLRRDQSGFAPPWFYLLGRLKPGFTTKTAAPHVQILAERLARVYRPLYPRKFAASLETFADASVGKFRRTLFTLLAAVGLLLLIACLNVANLLLARASVREREFAIRSSLGAGWWRVAWQLFTESMALAFLGAASGCLFAWGALRALIAVLPQDTFPEEAVIGLNTRVLLATVAVTVGTAVFFGLVPVMSGLRRDINSALKAGGREHSGFRRGRLRDLLVVSEVAISLVLLAAAGVTMRSFLRERAVPLGINPQHLLTAQVFLTKNRRTVEQQARFEQDLIRALRRLPGVLDVATTTDFLPFGGAPTEFDISGKHHSEQRNGQFAIVDPDLFRTLQVPVLRGRNFSETDVFEKHKVAVVNQAFVEKFFRGENPVGRRVEVTTLQHLPEPVKDPSFEIIGVTANFKNRGLRQPIVPEVFVPSTISALGGFSLMMRTAGDAHAFGKIIEGTALTMDGSTVVRHIRTMEDGLENEEYAKPRFGLEIFSIFAVMGMLLVSVGLYSVISYTVAQRRRELGIRLALGATAAEVQAMVIGTGMRLVAVGIVAGVLVSFLLLRFLQSQIWGVTAHDPVTFAAVAGILVLTGIAACYFPSLLASRVDPAFTLRSE